MNATRKNPEAFKNLSKALKELDTTVAKVGWLDGQKHPLSNDSISYIASLQELGYPPRNIPKRPFFRPTINKKSKSWSNTFKNKLPQVLLGKMIASQLLTLVGIDAAADVYKTISQIRTPPLSDWTIANRLKRRGIKFKKGKSYGSGITKPLNDTGTMIATLTHSVGKS